MCAREHVCARVSMCVCVQVCVCVCVCSGRIRIDTSPKPPSSGPGRREIRSAKKVNLVSARKKHPYPFLAGSKKVALPERKDKTHPSPRAPGGGQPSFRKFQNTRCPSPLVNRRGRDQYPGPHPACSTPGTDGLSLKGQAASLASQGTSAGRVARDGTRWSRIGRSLVWRAGRSVSSGRVTERPGLRAHRVRRGAWGGGVGDPEEGRGVGECELALSLQ